MLLLYVYDGKWECPDRHDEAENHTFILKKFVKLKKAVQIMMIKLYVN